MTLIPRITEVRPSKDDLDAIQALAHLVTQPRDRELGRVLRHDWSEYPAIQLLIHDLGPVASKEELSSAARAFFLEVLAELDRGDAESEPSFTPFQVFRWHVIEGTGWDSLITGLREGGATVAERTLKNRQRKASELILIWARRDPEVADISESETQGPALAPPPPSRSWAPSLAAALALLIALPMILPEFRPGSGAELPSLEISQGRLAWNEIPSRLLGRGMTIPLPAIHLPEPFPQTLFPELPSRIFSAMVLPGSPVRVILGADWDGEKPGSLYCWDPIADEIIWESWFRPPDDEIITHDTLDESALGEEFGVKGLFNSSSYGSMGNIVAAVFRQMWSPCFVVFYDTSSGDILSWYTHAGHLVYGLVLDFNEDGDMELWLSGVDNSLGQPVFVALDPAMERGSSSSVRWKKDDPDEDALLRVILPSVPEVNMHMGWARVSVRFLDENHWDGGKGQLLVEVGAHEDNAYMAYVLRAEDGSIKTRTLLGDAETMIWNSIGLDPSDAEGLAEKIRLEGRWVDERTNAVESGELIDESLPSLSPPEISEPPTTPPSPKHPDDNAP